MADLESIFIREFNSAMHGCVISRNIMEVPLPDCVNSWGVSSRDSYGVSGVTEEVGGLFVGLNKSMVDKVPSNILVAKKKIDLVKRDFARDDDGNFILEDVKIPSGCLPVISDIKLNLPYRYDAPSKEFGFIDYNPVDDNSMYFLPKNCLYNINKTALALSVKTMRNFMGVSYKTWRFGKVFLHIIPYSPNRNYVGTRILKVGVGLDYSSDIRSIVDFWIANNVIPDIRLSMVSTGENLTMEEIPSGYQDYIPVEELSVGEKEIFGSEGSMGNEEGI